MNLLNNEEKLYHWCCDQAYFIIKGTLDQSKIDQLKEIDFDLVYYVQELFLQNRITEDEVKIFINKNIG